MKLPWQKTAEIETPSTPEIMTFDFSELTPREVTRRFYMDEYIQDKGREWNASMWSRVSEALEKYDGIDNRTCMDRLTLITFDIAAALTFTPDENPIAVEKDSWIYLCTQRNKIELAADSLQGTLRTFDDGRTLRAFAQDIEQMAYDTGYGMEGRLEKIGRRFQSGNILPFKPE